MDETCKQVSNKVLWTRSIKRFGGRHRTTVQPYSASAGFHIWT